MIALDTNIVVRLIAQDDRPQLARATELLARGPAVVQTAVLLETEWVLRAGYKFSRDQILAGLKLFCGLPDVELTEAEVVEDALESYAEGLDFGDALFVHGAANLGLERFYTFDRDLLKRASRSITTITIEAP